MRGIWGLSLLFWAATAAGFDYGDLVALIEKEELTSIEALLPRLPDELRANYVLMHTSRSLQKASFESPRVILFGKDARLTCALEGAGDTLECFQFVARTRSFDFRRIRFGEGRPVLSESNPPACLRCHGADPRPNWDQYPDWLGAYGSNDDSLSDKEGAAYAAFTARRATHARYRWLVQGPHASDPYMDYKADRIDVGHRPNLRFSDAVGHLNAWRTRRLLGARVTRKESLAFALRALACATPADAPGLETIFAKVGVSARDWSTRFDPDGDKPPPWDHQAGFSYLAVETAMAIVEDEGLTDARRKIRDYHERRYHGVELEYWRAMNAIVTDPDFFGGHFTENTGYACPLLSDLYGHS